MRSSPAATASRCAAKSAGGLLERLTQVEGFEHYLKRAFLGQKQFSIEGLDVMVPMLDEAVELGVEAGAHEVVIGMAHRGRLNVLAHIIGRPYAEVLREFEGERTIEAIAATAEGASGDVKYHLGAVGRATHGGRQTRRSSSPRTRAISRLSTRSSKASRAPSRPTARPAQASTTRQSRCRS